MIGGGGHAKVLLDVLNRQAIKVDAIVAPTIDSSSDFFKQLQHYESDECVYGFSVDEVILINGIGSLPGSPIRQVIFDKFRSAGYEFMSVIANTALVSEHCKLGHGVQVMPGAIINADTVIGDNCIINTGAIVEHDCSLGDNNHVAPGATLSGGVVCGKNVHIGTGANVIQGIQIGSGTLVGAGATVTKHLNENKKLYVAKPFLAQGIVK